MIFPGLYALNGWLDENSNKSYPMFHCLVPHVAEQAHFLIKDFCIVSVWQFKLDESLYPVIFAETASLVMHHSSVGTHLVHENCIYTKLFKCTKKAKIKDFNSPRNEPLIVLDYWSNNIEEYFHLRNPDNINLSEKSTTQNVKNALDSMVKHVNSM